MTLSKKVFPDYSRLRVNETFVENRDFEGKQLTHSSTLVHELVEEGLVADDEVEMGVVEEDDQKEEAELAADELADVEDPVAKLALPMMDEAEDEEEAADEEERVT